MLSTTVWVAGCGLTELPDDPAVVVQKADALVEAKKYAAAAAAYRQVLQRDSMNGAIRLKLANALLAAQDYGAGAPEMVRAADLLPGDSATQLKAASMLLALRRFPEASARVTGVLREQPNNVEALIVLANATAQLGDPNAALSTMRRRARRIESYQAALRDVRPRTSARDDASAEALFRQAMTLSPDAYETRVALVNFLWATSRQDEAEPMLRRLADDAPWFGLLNQVLGEYYVSRGRQDDGERYLRRAAESGDRDTALGLADFYVAAGRDAEAAALLEKFPDDSPPGSISLPRADIEFRSGRRDDAFRRVDGLLERVPRHPGGLALKAEFLLASGRRSEAVEMAKAAVTAAPTSAPAHLILGRALAASGVADTAFDELSEAVRLDPSDRTASRSLARHALLVGRPEIGVALAGQLLRTEPNDQEAAIVLITGLVDRRDYAAAATAISPLLTRFPASADLLVQHGRIHAAHRRSGARAAFEAALKLSPDSLDALTGLVMFELEQGNVESAKTRAAAAVSRHPEPQFLMLLSRVQQRVGDEAGSEATLRRVLSLDPEHVHASLALAGLLERRRRGTDAHALLSALLTRQPGAAEARLALAGLLEREGRTEEAEEHYRKILNDDPRAAIARYRLAAIHADRGTNLNVALDLASRAVQMLPDDPAAKDVLGWVHVKMQFPKVGLPHLEASVKADPDNALYRYHLGIAYLAVGQPQNGRTELSRALELDGGSRFAADARRQLALASR